MQTLEFAINKQVIRWENPCRKPVENSKGVVYAHFTFDEEWEGLNPTVVFDNEFAKEPVGVIWTGEPIQVPPEVLMQGRLRVSVLGFGDGGKTRLTTKRMEPPILVSPSGPVEAVEPEEATPELWEQAMALVGGYYTPDVSEAGTLSWSANRDSMPEIPDRNIRGPQGLSGVYVGSGEMPEGYNVQIDPDGLPTEDRGKLVYIDKDGVWSPVSLGPGLKIANGVLMLDGGLATASAILGSALVGNAVVGNGG